MLEMNIESIRVSLLNYQRVVILRVKESNRYLPIWIGPLRGRRHSDEASGIQFRPAHDS